MRIRRLLAATLILTLMLIGASVPNAMAEYDMPFYIEVDITNQIVTVYKTSDDSIVRQMICSSGKNDCTPLGEFFMCAAESKRERTPWMPLSIYNCFVKYGARIYRGYLFHSIPFRHRDNSTMDMEAYNQLGTATSHGCIRLRVEDAKFISDYCLRGTYVRIFKSEAPNEELRQMLLVSSYSIEDGIPYMEYMGYSENELGRGSTGEHVADIQARMRALGFYDGEISGEYDLTTLAAVKRIQGQLGFGQNGIASQGFQDVLFSDEAPVSKGTIPLRDGWSGPVVEQLQQAMAALGIYAGNIDGIYDVDVREAVQIFQSACGFSADGVATPEIQQAVYYEMEQLRKAFGTGETFAAGETLSAGETFAAEIVREPVQFGVVRPGNTLSVREKPDGSANSIIHLKEGTRVRIVKTSGEWSAVIAGDVKGYARNKFMTPETQDNVILRYTAGGTEFVIGHTLEEYAEGASTVAEEFSAYYVSENFVGVVDEADAYAMVDTGEESVSLNLRAEPEADAEVLAQIPNGTRLFVLSRQNEWTKVTYLDQVGYLMDDYLDFDSPEETEEIADPGETEETVSAIVLNADGGKAPVYEGGSVDTKRLGHLPAGTRVDVMIVDEENGWVKISLEGHEGWMMDEHLKFEM